jgi:CRISPR system Cascade subunit CasC
VEAAVQVAHAFTTHRAVVEDDFYTAIDDRGGLGAAFVGVAQFGSGVFYHYICVDADLLGNNLAGDRALCAQAIDGLITAVLTVSPRGRQNAFASRVKASYALLEVGPETPRTLAGAFHVPVGARRGEDDQIGASIQRLSDHRLALARAYDETFDGVVEFGLGQDTAPASQLIQAARKVFDAPEVSI